MVIESENLLDGAFQRLESALERLESAASRPDPAHAELELLRERHAAMKARVGSALGDLDSLLASLEAR